MGFLAAANLAGRPGVLLPLCQSAESLLASGPSDALLLKAWSDGGGKFSDDGRAGVWGQDLPNVLRNVIAAFQPTKETKL
jgi:hypothetical protein